MAKEKLAPELNLGEETYLSLNLRTKRKPIIELYLRAIRVQQKHTLNINLKVKQKLNLVIKRDHILELDLK